MSGVWFIDTYEVLLIEGIVLAVATLVYVVTRLCLARTPDIAGSYLMRIIVPWLLVTALAISAFARMNAEKIQHLANGGYTVMYRGIETNAESISYKSLYFMKITVDEGSNTVRIQPITG